MWVLTVQHSQRLPGMGKEDRGKGARQRDLVRRVLEKATMHEHDLESKTEMIT